MTANQTDRQSSVLIMNRISADAAGRSFKQNQWGKRHDKAWSDAALFAGSSQRRNLSASSLSNMIRAWVHYADAHQTAHGSGIVDDGFLGSEWEKIGGALLALLNGDLGALDGGTLDKILRAVGDNEGADFQK